MEIFNYCLHSLKNNSMQVHKKTKQNQYAKIQMVAINIICHVICLDYLLNNHFAWQQKNKSIILKLLMLFPNIFIIYGLLAINISGMTTK